MIRVFAAIPLPPELAKKIQEWKEKHSDLPVRWVSGSGLHITLIPPWDAERGDDAPLDMEALAGSVRPFKIKFENLTLGTSPKRPRLIWAMNKKPPAEILALKAASEAYFGRKAEPRPYNPHITICRFKEDDFAKFPFGDLDEKIDWEMEVNSVVLMESKLLHSGAEYEVIKEIKLKNA